jgi:hypothetical protein
VIALVTGAAVGGAGDACDATRAEDETRQGTWLAIA